MSRNFYSEINLHLTWHTKESRPLLTPEVEEIVHHYPKGRCIKTPEVFIHEIGGIEDHVHLCVTVPPTLLISDWIGRLKGSSSHEANEKMGDKMLEWQTGYGVVSFGTRDLPWVKEYVANQRERHARGRVLERLERTTQPETEAEAEQREAP